MADLIHMSLTVQGRVQGVYYRAFTARLAKSLSINGQVKNVVGSNDVEVEAEGERTKLETFLSQLRIGPPEAVVENIDIKWSDYTGRYTDFDVRY